MRKIINRAVFPVLKRTLDRGKSVLLLGPRQTGKTTVSHLFEPDLAINLIRPKVRQRYEATPDILTQEVEGLAEASSKKPLIFIDEVQKTPLLLDVAQDLIDRGIAQFIFTGSSARKLRKSSEINLLPGRVVIIHMDPLCLDELPSPQTSLNELLIYGSLPGVATLSYEADKELDLQSYGETYLEEEVRAEALVRHLGEFGQFLRLAAGESGNVINLSKLSQEIGVTHNTIGSYYQILEDCLIAAKIEPLTHGSARRKLVKSPMYLFFDLGVRRICAAEGAALPSSFMGKLFEQFIGLEILRFAHMHAHGMKLMFWRDHNGAEVDWVIEYQGRYLPIEVKLTDKPKTSYAKHLNTFLTEYEQAESGLILCTTPNTIKINDQVKAVSWITLLEELHRFIQ